MKSCSQMYEGGNSDYLQKNSSWHVEDSAWKADNILKILSANSLSPCTIADVGCGAGEILNQMHGKMPETVHFTGFDISSDAATMSRERKKERLKFKCADFMETDNFYDLILCIDVFEHIEDYYSFLKRLRERADRFVFHIPLDLSVQAVLRNKLSDHRRDYGHLHYFSRNSALETLRDCGYKVKDWFYTAGSLELPARSVKAGLARLPRKILYSLSREMASRVLGGFSLMVLAEKTDVSEV